MENDPRPEGPDALATALAQVHEHHRQRVEAAVRAGRPRLVRELVEEHADESLRRITGWPGAAADDAAVGHPGAGTTARPTRRLRRAVRP